MRLFVALELPEGVRAALERAQRELATLGAPIRWARPEGLHVTLAFLGEVASDRLPAIQTEVSAACAGVPALRLDVRGVGAFPHWRAPRVVWAGLEGDVAAAGRLQRSLADRLELLGFPREDRPFQPHVTLGRARDRLAADSARELERFAARVEHRFGAWTAHHASLVQSELHRDGSRYTTIYTARLQPDDR